jgi:hypothetical protein
MGSVNPFFYRTRHRTFIKAGPTAARIKLGAVIKQQGVAADAVVLAFGPMVFVATGESAFGGSLACDFISHRFCAFAGQQGSPLFGGLGKVCHEEQLMEMVEAQSGGKAA